MWRDPSDYAIRDEAFFGRAKVTVRAKGVRVNSVFLVQLRKKVGASLAVDADGFAGDGKELNHRGHGGTQGDLQFAGKLSRGGVMSCPQEVHRKCRKGG
jgi:hypothetical protein